MEPLMPLCPAFEVRILILPELESAPNPLDTVMLPPVAMADRPALIDTRPPTPLLPVPTAMVMEPPFPPPVDTPV